MKVLDRRTLVPHAVLLILSSYHFIICLIKKLVTLSELCILHFRLNPKFNILTDADAIGYHLTKHITVSGTRQHNHLIFWSHSDGFSFLVFCPYDINEITFKNNRKNICQFSITSSKGSVKIGIFRQFPFLIRKIA